MEAGIRNGALKVEGEHASMQHAPRTSLQELEHTIMSRQQEAADNPGTYQSTCCYGYCGVMPWTVFRAATACMSWSIDALGCMQCLVCSAG